MDPPWAAPVEVRQSKRTNPPLRRFARKCDVSNRSSAIHQLSFTRITRNVTSSSCAWPTNLRHEQTKIIKYNHLVANALILYNTREMTRVIQELITEGYPVNEQTIRLLGPYRTEHVNRFGSYTLNMDREIPPLEIKFELPV